MISRGEMLHQHVLVNLASPRKERANHSNAYTSTNIAHQVQCARRCTYLIAPQWRGRCHIDRNEKKSHRGTCQNLWPKDCPGGNVQRDPRQPVSRKSKNQEPENKDIARSHL